VLMIPVPNWTHDEYSVRPILVANRIPCRIVMIFPQMNALPVLQVG
jgi:hypothetical protein